MVLKKLTSFLFIIVLNIAVVRLEQNAEDNGLKALQDISGDEKTEEKQKQLESMSESLVKTYEIIIKAVSEPGYSAYAGCYTLTDTWDVKKTLTVELGGSNEVYSCISKCWEKRQRFAFLWFGVECWCLNVIRGLAIQDDNSCSTPCKGNASQICGGNKQGIMYYTGYIEEPLYTQVTPKEINAAFQGCFYGYQYKISCPVTVSTPRMSVPMCMDLCENNLFQFAGLSNAVRCCCDHSLSPIYSKAKLQDCSTTCRYNDNDYYCGGESSVHFALYQTGATKIVEGSTPKIAKQIWMEPNIDESDIRVLTTTTG